MSASRTPASPDEGALSPRPHWLFVSAAVSLSAVAAAPPASAPAGPADSPPARSADAHPAAPAPDDALIEFLGDDDVPDARWWDFMKRKPPDPPAARPAREDSQP
jgi:hypothetical protein